MVEQRHAGDVSAGCASAGGSVAAAPAAPVEPEMEQGTLALSGAGAAIASRRSVARRPGARLPRDRDRGCAAAARQQAAPKAGKAGREENRCRAGNGRQRPRRQPVDPRQCRHAGTPDDDGVGTGSDAQPAAGDQPAQRGHRVQGAAAAAVQRHRRVAGRRHEDADAADRQCLAEAAADRARPVRRTRQADRTGDARRRHRARPPGARPDQGSADPYGAQLRRSRAGDAGRAAGRGQAGAGHDPAVGLS